jgi:nicotinamidase-related amidase
MIGAMLAVSLIATPNAMAQSIVDSWKSVQLPPPPALQPVSLDPRHTALLLLDFSTTTCTQARRPTCIRSLGPVSRLLGLARSRGALVVYSMAGNGDYTVPNAVLPDAGEPTVKAGVDKFMGTDLEKILKDHDIKAVIVTGTSAHGAVLYTASAAALRGLDVVVPVDGFSAEEPFAELYTAWHLKNAPASVSAHVTLTSVAQITFH